MGDGTYFALRHRGTGLCLEPAGGADAPAAGAFLVMRSGCTLAPGVLGLTRQALHFRFLENGGEGRFVLQHRSGKCLVPEFGASTSGATC